MLAWVIIVCLVSYPILGVTSLIVGWKEAGRKVEVRREQAKATFLLYKEIRRLNDRIDRTSYKEPERDLEEEYAEQAKREITESVTAELMEEINKLFSSNIGKENDTKNIEAFVAELFGVSSGRVRAWKSEEGYHVSLVVNEEDPVDAFIEDFIEEAEGEKDSVEVKE